MSTYGHIELPMDVEQVREALYEACDVVVATIPFIRRPIRRSQPYAAKLAHDHVYLWKWQNGLWECFARKVKCKIESSPSGTRIELGCSLPPLIGMAWVLVIRLMLVLWGCGIIIELSRAGWSSNLGFALVFGATLVGVNIFVSLLLSAARRIEESDHVEIKNLLVGIVRRRQAV